MKSLPRCFGKQSPYTVWFGDGSKVIVWASSEELASLIDIESLGRKCLFCENDRICFDLSRNRDFCIGSEIHI